MGTPAAGSPGRIPDLLVIGAGLAGLMAAQTGADAGLSVRVVAKGMGATHWAAGTVDVLGYLPTDDTPVHHPLEAVERLPEDHPYRRVGGAPRVARGLARFQELTQALKLPYVAREDGQNWWLPSPAGAPRPAYLAPQAQARGDLERKEPLLIVGFAGLRDFYPRLIAENLARQGIQARAASLPLNLLTPRRDVNTVQLARTLDRPDPVERLGRELRALARPGERIGLPAILGLERHLWTWHRLEAITEAPVFEIPTLPPSVPGIRLFQAWQRHLLAQGVRVEMGMAAIGFQAAGDRILWVETESAARPLRHRAGRFVLATGGILGGGIAAGPDGPAREVVFGLPLAVPTERRHWFRPRFLDPAGHPLFQGGVAVDPALRPVDPRTGQTIYTNLHAAGEILAGTDSIRERSLEGIALATGAAILPAAASP